MLIFFFFFASGFHAPDISSPYMLLLLLLDACTYLYLLHAFFDLPISLWRAAALVFYAFFAMAL